jgi:hypothetical protein
LEIKNIAEAEEIHRLKELHKQQKMEKRGTPYISHAGPIEEGKGNIPEVVLTEEGKHQIEMGEISRKNSTDKGVVPNSLFMRSANHSKQAQIAAAINRNGVSVSTTELSEIYGILDEQKQQILRLLELVEKLSESKNSKQEATVRCVEVSEPHNALLGQMSEKQRKKKEKIRMDENVLLEETESQRELMNKISNESKEEKED